MKCDVATVMERLFKNPAKLIRGVGAKGEAF